MYNFKWASFMLLLITNSIYNYVQHIFKPAGAFPYNQFVFILGQCTILNGHFLCYCSLPILYTSMYNIFSSQQELSHVTMVKIIISSDREMTPFTMTTINPQEIKVLKTLVWHLSRKPMKENNFFDKINNQ